MALSIKNISSFSHSSIFKQTRFPMLFSQQAVFFYPEKKQQIQYSIKHHQCGSYYFDFRTFCANTSSDVNPTHQKDSKGDENYQGGSLTTTEILLRLKRYGVSGVLAYGLLNTAYYLCTFLFVWLFVAPAPGRLGYLGAAERLLKVLAMVWAGSQVTKLVRAGGALALAPFVDQGLSWFTLKFRFESRGKAFTAIAAFCFGLAFMVFLVLTLLWS